MSKFNYPTEVLEFPRLMPPSNWKSFRRHYFKMEFKDFWTERKYWNPWAPKGFSGKITNRTYFQAYNLGYRVAQYIKDMTERKTNA